MNQEKEVSARLHQATINGLMQWPWDYHYLDEQGTHLSMLCVNSGGTCSQNVDVRHKLGIGTSDIAKRFLFLFCDCHQRRKWYAVRVCHFSQICGLFRICEDDAGKEAGSIEHNDFWRLRFYCSADASNLQVLNGVSNTAGAITCT